MKNSIVEIYIDGQWIPAAEIYILGETVKFEYVPHYAFGDNPLPVSLALPISEPFPNLDGQVPSFLYDLVPQGLGRKYLIEEANRNGLPTSDIALAQIGAFNPIGNIRIDTAVTFFDQWKKRNVVTMPSGFDKKDIVQRSEEFVSHIWMHAMLTAGTTGVQGAAPKFLLTQDYEGLFHADSALSDERSLKHWLVKLPRGKTQIDLDILRIESIYQKIASLIGLRTFGQCEFIGNMMFFERFDREVDNQNNKVTRVHQESLLAAAGISGFPSNVSLFTLTNTIIKHATNPVAEAAEFIKREFLNRALGNTDNHGRNTALQILSNGIVQLTPLYDCAPMFRDPEMIPRSCRWIIDGYEINKLSEILNHLDLSDEAKSILHQSILSFANIFDDLPYLLKEHELEDEWLNLLVSRINSAKELISG
ncbi:MAG TPA: HipA domain-containing protein [Methylophilus sp.]|uniref:type II toxin-antitoxin system HipA family toxin n=1 Tax=Methylophilus sp. TaxID=29541 RepID=UPI002BFAEE60|nr:HipA domain-containing protein [Methylophilus sp.]HSH86940.1 HipA domain-containing protein [Methylophilus sp.]